MTQPSTRRRPKGPTGSTRRSAGFTLIELMIAVAIVAILASIAYPSYTSYVEKTRRTDAMSSLMQTAGQLERCYTVTNDYRYSALAASGGTSTACVSLPKPSQEGFYEIASDAASTSASTFKIKADPSGDKANGRQVGDACGVFTLTHRGEKGADGADCW